MRRTASDHNQAEAEARRIANERAEKSRATEAAIVANLAQHHPAFAYNSIHASPLYSSVASIHVGSSYVGYTQADDRATWAEVAGVLAEFPPVDLILHRRVCVGVRPKADDDNAEGAEVTDLWPVTIRINPTPHGGPEAEVSWYTDLAPGLRVRMDVILRHDAHPARVVTETKRDRSTGVLVSCKRTGFVPAEWFLQASADSQRINYGGGSPTDPGQVLIYWPEGSLQPGAVAEQWAAMNQPKK